MTDARRSMLRTRLRKHAVHDVDADVLVRQQRPGRADQENDAEQDPLQLEPGIRRDVENFADGRVHGRDQDRGEEQHRANNLPIRRLTASMPRLSFSSKSMDIPPGSRCSAPCENLRMLPRSLCRIAKLSPNHPLCANLNCRRLVGGGGGPIGSADLCGAMACVAIVCIGCYAILGRHAAAEHKKRMSDMAPRFVKPFASGPSDRRTKNAQDASRQRNADLGMSPRCAGRRTDKVIQSEIL